jgi:hypothetical protein
LLKNFISNSLLSTFFDCPILCFKPAQVLAELWELIFPLQKLSVVLPDLPEFFLNSFPLVTGTGLSADY